ncbi:S41 family peptidase [Pontibacter roseus]|uniref:S41 family peptidase n=1 Tax=Pontibacter roseus TaxID=336989 RepID=UPI00037410DC|nr:S41 family peptidase [Pontibacter roseus]
MKKPLCIFVLLFASVQLSFAQTMPDSVKAYVTQALDIMKRESIHKHQVDWDKVYAQTFEKAKNVSTIKEAYPAINYALAELKDGHSRLYEPEIIRSLKESGYAGTTTQKLPMPTGNMIDGKYAFISIPGFAAMQNKEQLAFVDSVQSVIKFLDAQNPKGWIIDLRLNQGGNLEPMYAGLIPLLGEGKLIGWADADNKITYQTYKNGAVTGLFDSLEHSIEKPYTVKSKNLPIAVLIGSSTASSGEMTAIAFVGRKHTKLIGTNTVGLTTGNNPRVLSDGAWLNLTSSRAADRSGRVYGKGLTPDITLQLTKSTITNSYLYISAAIRHIDKPKK